MTTGVEKTRLEIGRKTRLPIRKWFSNRHLRSSSSAVVRLACDLRLLGLCTPQPARIELPAMRRLLSLTNRMVP
jgi:hypothetical protein